MFLWRFHLNIEYSTEIALQNTAFHMYIYSKEQKSKSS